MSVKYAFQTAVVGWVDLLGYGSQIAQADFIPTHPQAEKAHRRLRAFHQIVAKHSRRNFPSLVTNDGAILYRDLSYRCNSVTYDFIRRAWNLFQEVNSSDLRDKNCGARMVVAAGFRVRGRRAGIDQTAGHVDSIFRRFERGDIDAKQAIHEASRAQAKFDIVPQLQSNYAFTKAYLAETGGSKVGFAGKKFYLDMSLLEQPVASDINVARTVDWHHAGLNMRGCFGEVESIVDRGHGYMPKDTYLNGLEVAKSLSKDPNILEKLRNSKMSRSRK